MNSMKWKIKMKRQREKGDTLLLGEGCWDDFLLLATILEGH